ncbi:hypothetical protein H4R35_000212 [Dimargaris xerosporica]|nr:hypothetical protein H4R35_000212 [Dimargaris xerosporica]
MDAVTICLECTSTVISSVKIPANQLDAVKYYLEQRPYMVAFKTKRALSNKRYQSHYHPDDVDEDKHWIVCFVNSADSDVLRSWLSRLSQLIGSGRFQSQSYKDWNHHALRLTTASPSSSLVLTTSCNIKTMDELPKETQDIISPAEAEFRRLKALIENGSDCDIDDELKLFIYPFSGIKSVTVTTHDLYRLNDGEYLNDSVIEFYLKYLQERLVATNPELAANVHIFNTFFYPQLVAKSNKTLAAECYDRVKSWTSKVDIFKKRYIIIPIHERAHWYLALIVNPGLMVSEAVDEESTPSSSLQPPTTPDSTKQSCEAATTPPLVTSSQVQVSSTEVSPSQERIDVNLTNLTSLSKESPTLLPVPDFTAVASIGDSIKRRYEKKLRSELKRHSRSPRQLYDVNST